MAIEDRTLAAGTKLWATYKSTTHTAEVVDVEGGLKYRLDDGREFKSPSAAGTAITEKACNGWTFWTVGEAGEKGSPVNAVPKPEPKRRGRKQKSEAEGGTTEETGLVLPIIGRLDEQFECGECEAVFPTRDEAAAHLAETHPAAC